MTRRRYPTSLSELSEQGNNPYEQILRSSADALKSHWRNNWREILAVGPFAQHRSLLTIPFIVYGDIRSVYPTLDAMSEALADTYSEFGVLPDIFVFKEKFVEELSAENNWNWHLTKRFSISLEA